MAELIDAALISLLLMAWKACCCFDRRLKLDHHNIFAEQQHENTNHSESLVC